MVVQKPIYFPVKDISTLYSIYSIFPTINDEFKRKYYLVCACVIMEAILKLFVYVFEDIWRYSGSILPCLTQILVCVVTKDLLLL